MSNQTLPNPSKPAIGPLRICAKGIGWLARGARIGHLVESVNRRCQQVKNHYKNSGLTECSKKIFAAIVKRGARALGLPWLFRKLVALAGYRVVAINADRIGHLTGEMDGFAKEHLLQNGWIQQKGLILGHKGPRIANEAVLELFSKFYSYTDSKWVYNLLTDWGASLTDPARQFEIYDYLCPIDSAAKYPKVLGDHCANPPIVAFSVRDRTRGSSLLKQLGIPDGAWYVCVHCREAGFNSHDDYQHDFRNAHIDSYRLAMQAIVERGGWCIRMGDPTMAPLSPMHGVVDYAHHPSRSAWLDVFIAGTCRFFLGSASGPAQIPAAFGIPCAIAHQAPMGVAYHLGIQDISIPKLYWSNAHDRVIPLPEVLGSPMSNYRYSYLFREDNISLIDNSPEDIRDLALEMFDRVEGNWSSSKEDEDLQQAVRNLFRIWHYSFYAKGRIGKAFLHKHRNAILGQPAVGRDTTGVPA